MEKFEFKRLDLGLEAKQLDFSMIVGSGANACPEITEFYNVAMINKTDEKLFLNVPNNKGTKRIPILTTGRVLRKHTCAWEGSDVNLNAKEIKVDKVSAMVQICVEDIEDSFEVWNMASGANGPVTPQALLSFIWNEIARAVRSDIEYLRWYGDKSVADAAGFTDLTDGYLKRLEDNVALINVVSTPVTITPANVVGEFYRALQEVAPVHRAQYETLTIAVSSNVYLAFAVAQATGNTSATHLTADGGDLFIGKYRISEVPTLEDDIIIISPKQDMVYSYDLLEENFIVVDRNASAAEPTMRFRVNLFLGFDFYDYANVVYYGPAL